MNGLIAMMMGQLAIAQAQEEKMCREFEARAEKAITKYWDACKYLRKKKKEIRKRAKTDFVLYTELSKPVLFNF